MIYKIGGLYYIDVTESIQDKVRHLQNIQTGESLMLLRTEIEDMIVPVERMLSSFFDAQWIGESNTEKMTIAMMQEVSEALNELDWKPWKSQPENLEAYLEELADVGIFLLLCTKTAGYNLDDLLSAMIKKHIYNLIRKDHKPRN